MKHHLSILILSLLLLVACDPAAELGTPFHKGQEVVLTAAIGEQRPQMMPQKYPHPQRISGKDSDTTINLLWDEGDEIRVRVGEASSVFTLIDGAGTANASFIGTMPADGSGFEVSYPVNYSDTILQQQAYVPNGIAKGLMKMSTPSPGTIDDGFTLKAEHAVLGLQLTGHSEIGKLVLTRNAEKGATSVESYTLNCKLSNSKSSGVTLTDVPTLFYIVLPTGTWEHGFTVTVYAADNTTIIDTFVTQNSFTFTAANATTMAAKDVLDIPEPCMVIRINDTISINLMCVEGGTFRMGVGAENYVERDDPQSNKDSTTHLVTLSDYYMAQTAVTQGLWEAVMGTDIRDMVAQSVYPSDSPQVGDMYPMEYVRLKDALAFIDELNRRTGLHFRLPTEAEREYAARGGNRSRGYKYPGSNDNTKIASPYGAPVAQKLPNELGIYDLSGCTREMCTDSWQTTYMYDEHVVNPVGPILNKGNRTMRGGYIHGTSRPFARYPYTPSWCRNALGFRIILPTETKRRMIHVSNTFFEMCFVEGGTFTMGSKSPDAQADEQPVHEVTLSDYYIGQTEVTQYLWKTVMGSENNPSAKRGDNLPVTNISWDDAQQFVQRLSQKTGLSFRLPTEAEWEYAARGGQRSQGYVYAGSNNLDSVAWHPSNCTQPQAVGKKKPNELGIYDMSGNVYEFCQDWYGPYPTEPQTNPQGPKSSSIGYRIVRGGCWQAQTHGKPDSHYCRIANRGHDINGNERIGLRIVLEVEK